MSWYVAVMIFVIIAIFSFFLGWTIGVNVYEKEHMIGSNGGLYMHEDDDIVQETKDDNDEVPKEHKPYVPSEPVDAMQMLLDGWCDDCKCNLDECLKNGNCMGITKGDKNEQ